MKRTIHRSRQARDDLIAIYVYLHERNPDAAERVFDAVRTSIERLATTPGLGHYWNSPDPRLDGLRVVPVRPYRNYLIFFRAHRDRIEVFRILHGARDLQPLIDAIAPEFDDDDGDRA